MREVVVAATAIALALGGCAQTGMSGVPGFAGQERSATSGEIFSYAGASDRNLRVEAGPVLMAGDQGFAPSDANWLQVRLRVTNTSSRVVTVMQARERLADGRVVNGATGPQDITEAPNYLGDATMTLGLGAAGTIVGSMLFPPAAIAASAAALFVPIFRNNRRQRTTEWFMREALLPGSSVAPGTSVEGYVFVPAVVGQEALILFYTAGGSEHSLTIPRTAR